LRCCRGLGFPKACALSICRPLIGCCTFCCCRLYGTHQAAYLAIILGVSPSLRLCSAWLPQHLAIASHHPPTTRVFIPPPQISRGPALSFLTHYWRFIVRRSRLHSNRNPPRELLLLVAIDKGNRRRSWITGGSNHNLDLMMYCPYRRSRHIPSIILDVFIYFLFHL